MRSDLLLRLADLLESDAANPNGIKFNLSSWGKADGFYPIGADVPLDCGTTACAMGLAAISGIFADEGLTIYSEGNFTPMLKTPSDVWWGFDAIQQLFDIGADTAYRLFSDSYYSQAKGADAEMQVAKRIRLVVSEGAGALNRI